MDDRRIFERITVSIPVSFLDSSSGKEGEAETTDISANGVGFVTKEKLTSSTPLELWLHIPDQHEPFYARGQVAWSKGTTDEERQRIGVRLEKAELMGLARALWIKGRSFE
jgi:hypothetical protein